MKKLIFANRYFLIPYFTFLLAGISLIVIFTKPELHILCNRLHHPIADFFFLHATNLGDGIWIAVLFIILLFVRYRYAFAFLSGSLAGALVVNLFKKVILQDMYRPSKYFELFETYPLRFVEGVKLHALQTFPSGHTATAFALFLTLAIITKRNFFKLAMFLAAFLVAYSRVYLSQHFVEDITAGSVAGVLGIVLAFFLFEKSNKKWLNRSLIRFKS